MVNQIDKVKIRKGFLNMQFKNFHYNYTATVDSFKLHGDYIIAQSKQRKLPVQLTKHNTCVALLFTDDALDKLQTKIDKLEARHQQLCKENKQLRKRLAQLEAENNKLQVVSEHIEDIRDTLY